MKVQSLFALLICIIVLFNSCEKNESEPCDSENENPDSNFVIGVENDFIIVTTFDSAVKIISWQGGYSSETFDIDSNGIEDISFISYHGRSSGGTRIDESSIKTINPSLQTSTIEMYDTSYRCKYTASDSTNFYVFYNKYSKYDCGGIIDTLDKTSISSHPKIFTIGDTISTIDDWLSDDLTLSYHDYSKPGTGGYRNEIVRGNWNNQNMKYILFKIDDRLGWFRLSVENHKEIRLYEYAIQKVQEE